MLHNPVLQILPSTRTRESTRIDAKIDRRRRSNEIFTTNRPNFQVACTFAGRLKTTTLRKTAA